MLEDVGAVEEIAAGGGVRGTSRNGGTSFSESWRDVLQQADTVSAADIRNIYQSGPHAADAAAATFERQRDYADRSVVLAHARADAAASLAATAAAVQDKIDTIAVARLSSVEPPRPIVVRVDEIGRAEALAYETVEAQADPRDPTTKYFLNRFLHDHFGRRRAMAQEYWPRSLRFLTTDLANAAFTASNEEIAMLAAGTTLEELRVENVVLRIQPNPTEPHGAVADFVLVRTRQEREVSREAWTATMQFVFMPVIPADLVIVNPMGIQVTYLETDRTLITETP